MRPWPSDRHLLWGALGSTAIMLWLGWYLKAPCTPEGPWRDGSVWQRACYTDVRALYHGRAFGSEWPYLEAFNEYPPLTAAFQGILGRLTWDASSFWHLNAILLAAMALATTWVLIRHGARQHIWFWALAPAVELYAFHNWDLLAILPATAGLAVWLRGRVGWGGALIALAACAKWYPGILLPLLGMDLIRREGRIGPAGWRFGLASVGVLGAVNVPVYLAAPEGWLAPYRFHGDRGATFESHWFAIQHYVLRWDFAGHAWWVEATHHGTWYLLVLAGLLALGVWRGWLDVLHACAAAVVGWLVVSPVLSMQYALWVLPFLAMTGAPAKRVAALFVADLLVFLAVWRFFGRDLGFDRDYEPLAVASMLRLAALLWLLAWLLARGRLTAPR